MHSIFRNTLIMDIKCKLILLIGILIISNSVQAEAGIYDWFASWKRYKLENANCSVLLPSKPKKLEDMIVKSKKGYLKGIVYQSRLGNDKAAYTISFVDNWYNPSINGDLKTYLDDACLLEVDSLNGKLYHIKQVTYDNHPGRELKCKVSTHVGDVIYLQRLYLIDNKMYSLSVSTPIENQFMSEHNKFLNSFQVE